MVLSFRSRGQRISLLLITVTLAGGDLGQRRRVGPKRGRRAGA